MVRTEYNKLDISKFFNCFMQLKTFPLIVNGILTHVHINS